MKRLWSGFWMSLSMFSRLPTVQRWDETCVNLILPWFPVVGLLIGTLWFGFACFLLWAGLPKLLLACLLLLFPLFSSGFIHIDGMMDTADALASQADLSKKRLILKDSHVGAFAVIALVVYLLIGFCCMVELLDVKASLFFFVLLPVASRCTVGWVLLRCRPMSDTGFAVMFKQHSRPIHRMVLLLQLLLCFWVGTLWGGLSMMVLLGSAVCVCCGCAVFLVKQFDGISGDLCGFMLTMTELAGLFVMALLKGVGL